MSHVYQIILVVFMCISAFDKAFLKNRLQLGPSFNDGVHSMGPLALSMIGMMCFAPVLGRIITPIIAPIYRLMGADPAIFAGTVLAVDMGAYPLAQSMTTDPDIAILSGIILGSMLGATIVFSIPVSLSIAKEEDHPYIARGTMLGMISIPVGAVVSALIAGIPFVKTCTQLLPTIIFSLLIIWGLLRATAFMMKIFKAFSSFIIALMTVTFALAVVEELTGFAVIAGMSPIKDQIIIVGTIAITLAGTYPFMKVISKLASPFTKKLGGYLGVNDVSMMAMISVLASSMPTFHMLKDMNPRGKIMAIAFSVPAATAFGDHLAYVSAEAPEVATAMMVGKLAAGVLSVFIVLLFTKDMKNDLSQPEDSEENIIIEIKEEEHPQIMTLEITE